MTNNSVVLNKPSIEVAKAEEGMDLLDICQLRPLQNSINLFRVSPRPLFQPQSVLVRQMDVDSGAEDPKLNL